jgi:hypothetical protein
VRSRPRLEDNIKINFKKQVVMVWKELNMFRRFKCKCELMRLRFVSERRVSRRSGSLHVSSKIVPNL